MTCDQLDKGFSATLRLGSGRILQKLRISHVAWLYTSNIIKRMYFPIWLQLLVVKRGIYLYTYTFLQQHIGMTIWFFARGIFINSESCQLTPSEQSETGASTFKLLGFTMAIAKCQVLWLECQTFGMWAHVIFHECHESDVHTLIFTWKLNSWIAFGGSVAFPPIGHGSSADFFALRGVKKSSGNQQEEVTVAFG